jgi:hypothetical protein
MKTGTKQLLFAGAAAVGVGAYFYRDGINHLQFGIDGYTTAPDGTMQMRIRVVNPSKVFGYPVPKMIVNAFDNSGSFAGTVINHQLQYIPANGVSYIYGTVMPNYQNLAQIIANVITGGSLPTGLNFHGEIIVGRIKIPFETNAGITGMTCCAPVAL